MKAKPTDKELILEGYRGSISMGIYVKDHIDDKDIFGIFIPPKEYILGLKIWEHYEKIEGEYDYLYYNLKKYISLALQGNPNVLCLMWLEPQYYLKKTPLGELLIENRNLFVSKQCFHSFAGYASGQLRKMTQYSTNGYMGEKRKQLVDKFGYDCKNASHAIRLLKQGIEFLTEGELRVFRPDAQQLLSIKMGEWTLEQVKAEAEKLYTLAHEAYVRSTLPNKPDYDKANKLLIDMTESYWQENIQGLK